MNEDERGDVFRGVPKLRLLVVLEYYLGVVGERSRILKFSMHHQDQSMESSSNEGERSASTYPCRSRAKAFKRTGLMESYSS